MVIVKLSWKEVLIVWVPVKTILKKLPVKEMLKKLTAKKLLSMFR